MNNKFKREIDKFIDFIKNVIKESNYQDISNDFVYHHLVRYGIDPKARTFSIEDQFFDKWINRFKDNQNIDVYVDPNWSYFCQFVPTNKSDYLKTRYAQNHIKLYIPLDPNHMYEGANQIFDFLSQNRIPHMSKIGKAVRNDSIVIRVLTKEDAEKVMNFVKNNKYIQSGLVKTNPFVPNEKGVGYACDGLISYNETIAHLLANYINLRKNRGEFKYIGASDFNIYASSVYKNIFSNGQSAEELFKNNPNFKKNGLFNYIEEPQEVYSLKIALGLYVKAIKNDFDKKEYYEYYDSTLNQDSFMLENNFDQVSYDKDTLGLLRSSMETLTEHYESSDKAKYYLSNYIKTGDLEFITTYKNLRHVFLKKHLDRRVKEYLIRNKTDINSLLDSFNIYKKKEITDLASHVRFSFEVLRRKRDYETAYYNTCQYLLTNDCTYLTRDYGIRRIISESSLRDRVLAYIKKEGISVEKFVSSITGAKKSKENYLEDACRYTRTKYDQAYQDGKIKRDGVDWSVYALIGLIKNYDYTGFTRDNNSRKDLMSMTSRKDIVSIVSKNLGITPFELENATQEELIGICTKYIKKVTELDYYDDDVKKYK